MKGRTGGVEEVVEREGDEEERQGGDIIRDSSVCFFNQRSGVKGPVREER